MNEFLGCGHTAQGTDSDGNPVCVICVGIKPGARQVVEPPDLTGRLAKCCHRDPEPSSFRLAFFEQRPDREFDNYYCGHAGWD